MSIKLDKCVCEYIEYIIFSSDRLWHPLYCDYKTEDPQIHTPSREQMPYRGMAVRQGMAGPGLDREGKSRGKGSYLGVKQWEGDHSLWNVREMQCFSSKCP